MAKERPPSLLGRTVRWTFREGPTMGKTFEHVFAEDGSVTYRNVNATDDTPGHAETAAVERITPDVHVVSYLAASGYTLTVVLNFRNMSVVSFASNSEGWFPAHGSFELA